MVLALVPTEAHLDPAEMAALVRRARMGETTAYERLYRLHVPPVYALCLRLCGDPGRAKECAQEVFVLAWQRLGSLQIDAAFAGWLRRIAVNVSLMALRSRGRLWSRESGSDVLDAVAPVTPRRGEPVALRLDLERAIARLPDRARSVLVLHDIEGYSHEEIAAELEIATGTSKTHLHRARCSLREVLRG